MKKSPSYPTQEAMNTLPTAHNILQEHAKLGVQLRKDFFANHTEDIILAARTMAQAIAQGKKILLCGNGGSAADAQHIAGELVNRFLLDRPPLPAIALTTDTSVLSAIGNDFGFDQVFTKQVQALGQEGDVFVGISTSGNSPNVLLALGAAKQLGLHTVGLVGNAGQMAPLCDILLPVPHAITPLVQEVHITAGHMLCRLIDYYLFENIAELGLDLV